jgi:outer membrane receptor protein involved in Fe transport
MNTFKTNGLLRPLALAFLSLPAYSDEQAETAVEDVLVTALRRESTARETPISLSALTSEDLERARARELADLQAQVPGFSVIDNGPSNTRLVIRGIQGVGEPIVGLHYDETSMSGVVGASNDAAGSTPLLSLIDVERVEILRGPQGTLYGSGAMSGAVRVLWQKPSLEQAFRAHIEGNTIDDGSDGWKADGVANIPIAGDALQARVVAYGEHRGGYLDNAFLGQSDSADTDVSGARLSLRSMIDGGTAIDLTAAWQDSRGDVPLWNLGLEDFEADNQVRILNRDEISLLSLTGTHAFGSVNSMVSLSRTTRTVAQVQADVSYQFGTNINNAAVCQRLRGGGAPCSPAVQATFNDYVRSMIPGVVYPVQDSTSYSAEGRLSSSAGSQLDWTAGVYYTSRKGELENRGRNVDASTGDLVVPAEYTFQRQVDEELKQLAAYGEATWHATKRLDLTGGARLFRYEREVGGGTTQGLDLINAPLIAYRKTQADEDGAVFRLNSAFNVASNHLLYLEASQGYRPGGANQVVNLPAELVAYEPDRILNFEVGSKSSWFDDRLTVNADVFRMDWRNMQVSGSRPDGLFRFISNAGKARAEGFELEAAYHPMPAFSATAHLTLLDAKLIEDQASSSVVAPGRKGDRVPYTTKVSAGLVLEHRQSWGANLMGSVRLDGSYRDSSYSEFRPTNAFYRRVPSATLLNARIAVTPPDERWQVAFFGTNLLNDVAVQSLTANGITLGRTLAVTLPPRTIGLDFQIRL